MLEYLRQFLARLSETWNKLEKSQKTVLAASAAMAFLGLVGLVVWPGVAKQMDVSESNSGFGTLFRDLDAPEAARIVEGLKSGKVEYRLENDGKDILVKKSQLDEQRLALAAQGLPKSGFVGWEIFDKTQLGLTDFVQNINYRRALEGEIARTIMGLSQVENARVLISIPKPSLFTEKEQPPTASVVIKTKPGQEVDRKSVKGIAQLIASSVEGLKPSNVTILDNEGRVLNRGGGEGPAAVTEANNELRAQVELQLQSKVSEILDGVVGAGNHRVQVSADIDFDQVEKTAESFNPQSKVVRSEQTEEETKANSPAEGDVARESRTANYEIDRTVVKSTNAPGSIRKRLTVSVAVDGRWEKLADSVKTGSGEGAKSAEWKPRTPDEVAQLAELVRNAVGAQPGSDNVFVTCVKFENPMVEMALEEMEQRSEPWSDWIRWGIVGLVAIAGLLLLRSLVKILQEAMTPPQPAYAQVLPQELSDDEQEEQVYVEAVRVNELLNKLESMTKAEPGGFAKLVRSWLQEGSAGMASVPKKGRG
ncbi:MAG TPA: flagellar basal-body MS-ring/collar protein FliF [Fibrobacteria bacterium]|nr:flagellar basal-body MS-ring/collar protein FliF [Fibrobacteria bacterium]